MRAPCILAFSTMLCLLLTGCGAAAGGGGTDGGGAPGSSPGPGGAVLIGKRSMPDYTVVVSADAEPGSGKSLAFYVDLQSTGSAIPPLTDICIRCAEQRETATYTISAHPTATPGRYLVQDTLPVLGSQTRAWVTLTHADGSVVESGSYDFHLSEGAVSTGPR